MTDIRLIATDLDGTFFGANHLAEPRTVAAANAAVDAGLIVVAATGRSWFGGIERATMTGARPDWFIGSNGGHRHNLKTGVQEELISFDPTALTEMIAALSVSLDGVGFGYELADGFHYDDRFLEIHGTTVDGFERKSDHPARDDMGPVGKLFLSDANNDVAALVEQAQPLLPPGMNLTESGIAFAEMTPPGANKGAALARLCAELGIDRTEVVAFGDNHNDLTMLEWAGRGIAMANAVDAAKELADEVTASNVDFGVAQVIESLLS